MLQLSVIVKNLNSYCFSSLASVFASINHFKAAAAIYLRIKESLKSEERNRIHFATDIMQNKKINIGETRVHYSLMKYRKKGEYDILVNSANVTLVQLMDSLVNVNHGISVVGSWIFDSNYERALVLNKASLDIICAPSVGEQQTAKFEKVYYAVR